MPASLAVFSTGAVPPRTIKSASETFFTPDEALNSFWPLPYLGGVASPIVVHSRITHGDPRRRYSKADAAADHAGELAPALEHVVHRLSLHHLRR